MAGAEALVPILESVLRELTLFAAVGFLVGGADDLAIDLLWLVRGARRMAAGRIGDRILGELPPPERPGRLAVFVPAWEEAEVIGPMLTQMVRRFDGGAFTVFVGCYPNDPQTIWRVRCVAAAHARVRLVVNERPGPTTKADCLNAVWRAMEREERATGERFKAIVLHDAEDLVHPGEIALFDRLIERHALVQIPVLPLVDRRSRWVGGHYCDEFAQAHGKDLVVRDWLGVGIPLAGVGCAIDRALLGRIAGERDGKPFDEGSLTEDYELGLRLAERGERGTFARVRTARGGPLIAVEAHFPASFVTAGRQKTRWITGIALAGWERLGWKGGVAECWMRLRDRRAILAAIVLGAAYAALVLGAVHQLAAGLAEIDSRPISPTLALCLQLVFVLLAWRLGMRALFTARVYGWREGVRAVPRAVISNIIAIAAARKALFAYVRTRADAPPRWDKTAHVFPELPA